MNRLLKLSMAFLCVLLAFQPATAQGNGGSFPNGFHASLTGAWTFSQKPSSIPCEIGVTPPVYKGASGWNSGLELSYHFCNYFGVSASLAYGNIAQFRRYVFAPLSQFFENGEDKMVEMGGLSIRKFQIPLAFEFHYPIREGNWSIFMSLGCNLLNVPEAIEYGIHEQDRCSILYQSTGSALYPNGLDDFTDYFVEDLYRIGDDAYKVKADLLMGFGVYYRLPYSDLLRAAVTLNHSFKDRLYGFYEYPLDGSWGTVSYRHNCIGIQLAYIHTFNYIKKKRERDGDEFKTFNVSRPIHSVALTYNTSFAVGSRIDNKQGMVNSETRLDFSPELSLKYNCTFSKGFGLSVDIPFGMFYRHFLIDLSGSVPEDTVWSNGAIGQENLAFNKGLIHSPQAGLAFKASYLKQIHPNIYINPELGIRLNPIWSYQENLDVYSGSSYIMNDDFTDNIAFATKTPKFHIKNNWLPNLSGAVNFLVHGKNPSHNFVFGLNFNVDFTKRVTIDYQTVPTFPDKYKSSGQFVFNMTTIGLHVGYQFMTGRKQAIGNK